MTLTRRAVTHRSALAAIVLAALVLGLYGLERLPVDFLPSITYPMIKVHIWWRGATPEEVERNLGDPIERQMATVDDVDYLESSSIEGMYTLLVNFRYGVDVNVAYQDCLAAMARAARQLPSDIEPPVIIKADPSQLPVVQITAASDEWDLVRLRTWADEWLQDQLVAVPGVAGAEIVGGLRREIRVHVDHDSLAKYGLDLTSVLRRLRDENLERFGGRVTVGPREIIARTMGEYASLDEIRGVVLRRRGGSVVTVGDVAGVVDAGEDARVLTRLGGRPCVKLSVLKQSSANTVAVADGVLARLEELRPGLPPGLTLGLVENQADYVRAALTGVRNSALQAAALVVLIVWLFLGSWRQVLVMALTLPLILIVNFGLMSLGGFSLNIFSLGGLVVAIGVLLDNSTVVIENITSRRKARPDESDVETAVGATEEVGEPVAVATLAFVALFLPFLLVPGLTSLLFRELILVIAGIVVVSLVVALTVTPALSALILTRGPDREGAAPSRFTGLFAALTRLYGRSVAASLRHPAPVASVFVLVVLAAVGLGSRLSSEFLPQMDDGRVMVKVRLPTGASVRETDRVLVAVEAVLAGDPHVESVFTLVGGKVWGLVTYEIANEGEVNVQLVPRGRRPFSTKGYITRLRPLLAKIPVPGGRIMVSQLPVKGIRKLGDADVEIKIRGADLDVLDRLARQTAAAMGAAGGLTNVMVSQDLTKPEFRVLVDRTRAAELGVTVADAAAAMQSLVTGSVATHLREGAELYPIRVLIPEAGLTGRADVENLPVTRPDGSTVRLRDLARVVEGVGPVEIVREDQIKQIVTRADASGVSIGEAVAVAERVTRGISWPLGYEYSIGGQGRMMTDMRATLLAILGFAVFFSFIVLAVQFDGFRLPFLLLLGVPGSVAGMVFALALTGLPLGATVVIGVLVVVSATVNDGVLLMTLADELRSTTGLSAAAAVARAAEDRFRPRVMTTLSTLVGFVPLALALEEGGDMLQPMAAAAIGGLVVEILVALYFMPVAYALVSRETPAPLSPGA